MSSTSQPDAPLPCLPSPRCSIKSFGPPPMPVPPAAPASTISESACRPITIPPGSSSFTRTLVEALRSNDLKALGTCYTEEAGAAAARSRDPDGSRGDRRVLAERRAHPGPDLRGDRHQGLRRQRAARGGQPAHHHPRPGPRHVQRRRQIRDGLAAGGWRLENRFGDLERRRRRWWRRVAVDAAPVVGRAAAEAARVARVAAVRAAELAAVQVADARVAAAAAARVDARAAVDAKAVAAAEVPVAAAGRGRQGGRRRLTAWNRRADA